MCIKRNVGFGGTNQINSFDIQQLQQEWQNGMDHNSSIILVQHGHHNVFTVGDHLVRVRNMFTFKKSDD